MKITVHVAAIGMAITIAMAPRIAFSDDEKKCNKWPRIDTMYPMSGTPLQSIQIGYVTFIRLANDCWVRDENPSPLCAYGANPACSQSHKEARR